MKKIALISDLLFTFFAVGIPVLCFARNASVPLSASFLLAFLFGSLVAVGVFFVKRKKHRKQTAEQEERKNTENFVLYLATLPQDRLSSFFSTYFQEERFFQTKRFDDVLAFETDKTVFYPHFSLSPVDADAVAKIIRTETNKTKILLCGTTSPEAETLSARFSIEIKKADELFKTAKAKELLPETYPFAREIRARKEKRKIWFSKKNSRAFFVSSIFLFLSSLLTPFRTYYLLFGIMLLALSVWVRVFGL